MKPRIRVLFVFDLDGECKFIKNTTISLVKKYVLGCHLGWMNRRFCIRKGGSFFQHASPCFRNQLPVSLHQPCTISLFPTDVFLHLSLVFLYWLTTLSSSINLSLVLKPRPTFSQILAAVDRLASSPGLTPQTPDSYRLFWPLFSFLFFYFFCVLMFLLRAVDCASLCHLSSARWNRLSHP